MPQMTNRQWDEYKSIIRRCNQLEIERRDIRALSNENDKLKAQVAELRQAKTNTEGMYVELLEKVTAERDAAQKALEELQHRVIYFVDDDTTSKEKDSSHA